MSLATLACVMLLGLGDARADFAVAGIDLPSEGRLGARIHRPSYWLVGVALDRASGPSRLDDEDLLGDQLVGLSVTYRRAWFGATGKLVGTPSRESRHVRTAFSLGARVVTGGLGRQLSYGINLQPEAALSDNHWVLYASPLELGADLYRNRSLHVQLFVGVRYAISGRTIDNFVIAPNGFENEVLEQRLSDKLDAPWEGFVSLVFARRID